MILLKAKEECIRFLMLDSHCCKIGKNIYLDVYDAQNIHVEARYALLKKEDRLKMANYVFPGSRDGVKVIHKNGDVYQVADVHDYGFSSNALVKLNTT